MTDTSLRINLDIMDFVEKQILPRYVNFDRAHNLSHVTSVMKRSIDLASKIGADVNMALVIAAYHDTGLEGPRAIQHITGGKILMADVRLRKWFSPEQIRIMKEAIEDHRASASHSPRSIYGKIVAEADRDLQPESVFRRTVVFGIDNYPDKNREEQWKRFLEHLENKYSTNGYIKLWIQNSSNAEGLAEIRRIMANRGELRKVFDRIYNDVTITE